MEDLNHLRRVGLIVISQKNKIKTESKTTEKSTKSKLESNPGIILKRWIRNHTP